MTQKQITVEICKDRCGGIWLDNYELDKVDEAHEAAGEALLDIGPHTPVAVDHSGKRVCPKCPAQNMRRNYFSVKKEIEVDDCPACGWVWLDSGELAAIRKQFATEQERRQAADTYFHDIFGKDLTALASTSQAEADRAKKFARAFRFICPSYWIPGTQAGEAF